MNPLKLIIPVLATYRLAQMISWDNGPFFIFYKLRSWTKEKSDIDGGLWYSVDEGVNCPYCAGVWFAFFTLLLTKYPTRLGNLLLYGLAIAGSQAFMQGLTKGR